MIEEDNQELMRIFGSWWMLNSKIMTYSLGMYIVPLICLSNGEIAAFCVNTWHECMGYPRISMMRWILPTTKGHKLQVSNLLKGMKPYEFCALGKFTTWPHKWNLPHELPVMLKKIPEDICGLINPPCGPFRYFLALIDASTKWSHISLRASRNLASPRLLVQIIQLWARFSNHPI